MGDVTVLDGGMGRELHRVGAPFRQPEWSALALIEAPQYVREVHGEYVAAGAKVITTNAYALVPFHIGQDRFDEAGFELAHLAGRLARDVADRAPGVRVAGCLPPVLGSYRPDLFDATTARPLFEVLIDAQAPFVDVWLAETQSSIAEVELVRAVLDGRGATQPLWTSFTLADELVDGRAVLRSGESVSAAAAVAARLGSQLLSFNCSPPEVMEGAVLEATASDIALSIGVYANAFVAHSTGGAANEGLSEIRDDVTSSRYAVFAERWVAAGASVVGGCCGIGPHQIAALSAQFAGG
jgi:S-methylmethionine-dependent homocysteine/selenocysteine methylase